MEEFKMNKVIEIQYWLKFDGMMCVLSNTMLPGLEANLFHFYTNKFWQESKLPEIKAWIAEQNAANAPQLEVHELPDSEQIAICIDLTTNEEGTKRWSVIHRSWLPKYRRFFAEKYHCKPRLELKVIPMVEGEPEAEKC